MSQVTSKDGTAIAYERVGAGPPLILIDGALCSRACLSASALTLFRRRCTRDRNFKRAPFA